MTRGRRGRVLLAVFIPPLLVLAGVGLVALAGNLDTGAIFRDPTTVLDGYPLIGAMSNVGVILWWLTAGICLFTWWLARPFALGRKAGIFLLTSGLLTVLLAIDDQFLIHDELAAYHLGLRERDVMAGYLVLVGGWLLLNQATIRRSEWFILAASLIIFATSIAFDYVVQTTMEDPATLGVGLDWNLFVEDGLKFLGIAGWAAWLIRFCHQALLSGHQPRAGAPAQAA